MLNRLFLALIASATFCGITAHGYVTTADSIAANPGKAGGVYYAYPVTDDAQVRHTTPPEGYSPFYVSHYGRHGSRYLISDNDYSKVVDLLSEAERNNALTPLGKTLKAQLDTIYDEARGRGGELTPLGTRQHKAIARRLITRNPEIFEGSPEITANSTVIMRCAHSMFAFCEALKEVVPSLEISKESASRTMDYLNYHSPESNVHSSHKGDWYLPWRKFRTKMTQPERLVMAVFGESNPDFVIHRVDHVEFMWDMYWITVDLQNMETDIRWYDLFTAEELFDLWQVFNFNFYACNSSYPLAEGTLTDNAKNLVRNILETAREYIKEGKNGATLRFGHDGNIIPLTALLQLDECFAYEADPDKLADVYADYHISPMASNLQIIFYRNPDDPEILVKFLLNENEIAISDNSCLSTGLFPYYKWSEVENWLNLILDTPSSAFIPEQYLNSGFVNK